MTNRISSPRPPWAINLTQFICQSVNLGNIFENKIQSGEDVYEEDV